MIYRVLLVGKILQPLDQMRFHFGFESSTDQDTFRAACILVARDPSQLHASKISCQTTSAPRIFEKFVDERFVLFGRVNASRDDVPELAALSSMDHFFH